MDLYNYGHWVLVYPFHGKKIDKKVITEGNTRWEVLRDAAGIPIGTSTAEMPDNLVDLVPEPENDEDFDPLEPDFDPNSPMVA